MPLVQRSVKNNHSYGAKFFETQHARYRLEDTQMGGCVGSLERLGLLADYAADIFKELIDSTSKIHKRITIATKRTHDLAEHLPEVTSFVDGSRAFLGRLDQRPAEGSREQLPDTCLLDHSSMPKIMQQRYESDDVYHMPNIKALDSMVDPSSLEPYGGTLRNRYSNPDFVRDEWIKKKEEENRLLEAAKQAKKQEKRAKRAKKVEIGGGGHSVEKKKALNWKDSLKTSGDIGSVPQQGIVRRSSITNVQSNSPVVDKADGAATKASAPSAAPVSATAPTSLPKVSVSGLFSSVDAPEEEKCLQPHIPAELAPPPIPTVAAPPPIPAFPAPPPIPQAPAPKTEPDIVKEKPPPPPAPAAALPPVVMASEPQQDDGPPSPPPAPKLFRPPPPPPPRAVPPPPAPVAPVAPGAPPPPPPPPPRAPIGQNAGSIDLLTAIRRGSVLKKVEPPVKTDKKKASFGAFGGTAVESILARRKALQQDDESSSDEGEEDEW